MSADGSTHTPAHSEGRRAGVSTARRGRRFRIVPRTLGWRLALSVTLLIAVSFAITFVAVYRGTASSLSHQIDREIAGDADAFSSMLTGTPARTRAQLRAAAERYVRSQPYTGSSTLLFALVPGTAPASNQPELFAAHAKPDPGETVPEQELENRSAGTLLHPRVGYSKVELPDVGHVRLLARRVAIRGGPAVTIGVGEPLATVHSAQVGVARAFILAGILVLLCALIAAYVIGTRFSAPLRRMASVAARVDAGDLHPRIREEGDPPEEVHVLAEAFNHMLDRLTEAFAGQRAFVADASHELRTPLTVIQGQLELLAEERDPSRAEVRRVSALVQAEIGRVSRLVDELLLLAKAERAEFIQARDLDLSPYVRELWDGTQLISPRRFELGELPEGTLRADGDRLAQALRNLLANAIEHTSEPDGLVRLSVVPIRPRDGRDDALPVAREAEAPPSSRSRAAHPADEHAVEQRPGDRPENLRPWSLRFVVDDDGPGIPADQREQVFSRFHRTDRARDRRSGGAGLGLAIVRAIAQAHGGVVRATASPERGARVELEMPGFTPAADGAPRHEHAEDGGFLAGRA